MQPWTKWFREKQEAVGTIEVFAQASGLGVRMVSAYRAGTIPRRSDQIAKIEAFFGEAGPLPGSRREDLQTFAERIAALEEVVVELRSRVAVLERPDSASDASSDLAGRPSATPRSAASLGALAVKQAAGTRRRPGSKRRNPDPNEGQR